MDPTIVNLADRLLFDLRREQGVPNYLFSSGLMYGSGYYDPADSEKIFAAIQQNDPQWFNSKMREYGTAIGAGPSKLSGTTAKDTLTFQGAPDEGPLEDWGAPVGLLATAGMAHFGGPGKIFDKLGETLGWSTPSVPFDPVLADQMGGGGAAADYVSKNALGGSATDSLLSNADMGFTGGGVDLPATPTGIDVPASFGDATGSMWNMTAALTAAGLSAAAAEKVAEGVSNGVSLDTALKLAGIAAPLAGAVLGNSAIKDAAAKQLQSSAAANDTLNRQFEQTRADLAPWREAGAGALNMLTAGIAPGGEFTEKFTPGSYTSPDFKFETDPGYQFRLAEGEKAIERAAAARKMRNSGSTYKDLLRFGQDTASGEYDRAFNRFDTNRKFDYNRFTTDEMNRYNRFNTDRTTRYNQLAGVAGTGQNAVNSLANAGATNALAVSNNQTNAGNVNAGATIAGVNSLNSGIGSALKSYNDAAMLDWLKGRTPTVGV